MITVKEVYMKGITGKITRFTMLAVVMLATLFAVNTKAFAADYAGEEEVVCLYGDNNPYALIFDANFYMNNYADVKAAFGNNQALLLQHFLQCGVNEGRQGCADFDPVTYMNRYPDLKAAYGNNMRKYYIHYMQVGKSEGRSGAPGAKQAYTTTTTAASNPYANAYDIMISFKNSYPEGMRYTNDDFYKWNGGIYYGGYGCAGFAFMLSDAVFGDKQSTIHYDMSKIRVGDILRINNDTHSVIVLEVNSDGIVVAEANYNSSVHWGRTFSWSRLDNVLDYVMTRY